MTTPTVKPNVNLDLIARLLRRIETHLDLQGWSDQPRPVVYLAYDKADVTVAHHIERVGFPFGGPIRTSRYSAQPIIRPDMFKDAYLARGLQPTAALEYFGFNLAYADPAAVGRLDDTVDMAEQLILFRRLLQEPGILGFVYSCETMTLRGTGAIPGGSILAHPDAQESRTVLMVDVLDRVHCVSRTRGKPALLDLDSDLSGSLTSSLRMLADAAMQRLPTDQDSYNQRYGR